MKDHEHVEVPCRDPQYDPDDWFIGEQPKPNPRSVGRALAVKKRCFQECPVALQCHGWALAEGVPWGIFGGYGGNDRMQIWKRNPQSFPNGRPTKFDQVMNSLLPQTSRIGREAARREEKAS